MDVRNNIHILNANLQITDNTKFLGKTIDCKLKFNKHVNSVLNKVSRVSGMIWRGRNILAQKNR